jgi:hypothetical protein
MNRKAVSGAQISSLPPHETAEVVVLMEIGTAQKEVIIL